MSLRGVSRDEVFRIAQRPEVIDTTQQDGCVRLFGSGLCLVLAARQDRYRVVTVLLRSLDQWDNQDARRRGRK
jgi:hypothetical protein